MTRALALVPARTPPPVAGPHDAEVAASGSAVRADGEAAANVAEANTAVWLQPIGDMAYDCANAPAYGHTH